MFGNQDTTVVEYLNERTRPGVFADRDGIRYWVWQTSDGPKALLLDKRGFAEPMTFLFDLERRPLALGRWLNTVEITAREHMRVSYCEKTGILCDCPLSTIELPSESLTLSTICKHYLIMSAVPDIVSRWELTAPDGLVLFESHVIPAH